MVDFKATSVSKLGSEKAFLIRSYLLVLTWPQCGWDTAHTDNVSRHKKQGRYLTFIQAIGERYIGSWCHIILVLDVFF